MSFEKDLPPAAQERLAEAVEEVFDPQGEILFQTGDPPGDCWLILSGKVGIFSPDAAGPENSKEAEVDPLGYLTLTMGAGQTVGGIALMQSQTRPVSARCLQDCEMLVIRHADFMSIVKDPISREWFDKDHFLQDHLVGMREFASRFVPTTGKSHATSMFVKRKYGSGKALIHEAIVAGGGLYVVYNGSVDFYRKNKGLKAAADDKSSISLQHPVASQRRQFGLIKRSSSGVMGTDEQRICTLLPGGVFSTTQVAGAADTPEPFTVVAGTQGCEVFACDDDNFNRLPHKVLVLLREHLARVARLRLERFSETRNRMKGQPDMLGTLVSFGSTQKEPSSTLTPVASDKGSFFEGLRGIPREKAEGKAALPRSHAKAMPRRVERLQVSRSNPSMPQLLDRCKGPLFLRSRDRHPDPMTGYWKGFPES